MRYLLLLGSLFLVNEAPQRIQLNNWNSAVARSFRDNFIVPNIIQNPPINRLEINYSSGVNVNLGNVLTPRSVRFPPVLTWPVRQTRQPLQNGQTVQTVNVQNIPNFQILQNLPNIQNVQNPPNTPNIQLQNIPNTQNLQNLRNILNGRNVQILENIPNIQLQNLQNIPNIQNLQTLQNVDIIPNSQILQNLQNIQIQSSPSSQNTRILKGPNSRNTQLFYTLVMIDPDAGEVSEIKHWLVVNIPGNDISRGQVIAEYVGSAATIGSGIHRYIFLVYEQPYGPMQFDEPFSDDDDFSYRPFFRVQQFANRYNLGQPVAGNFFMATWDETVPALRARLGLD